MKEGLDGLEGPVSSENMSGCVKKVWMSKIGRSECVRKVRMVR